MQINVVMRNLFGAAILVAAAIALAALADPVSARNASGKGDPEYGAGHTTPHGVKPGRGIFGKPEDHGMGGTSHVPGPKGSHTDEESHGQDDGQHDSGRRHVPGGKGGAGEATEGGHQDESGHDAGEDHDEGHEPGPKNGGGHAESEDLDDGR